MRLLRARLMGLLVASALALPAFAFAQPGYLCGMTGQVSHGCCCSGKQPTAAPTAEVKRQSCCQWVQPQRDATPSTTNDALRCAMQVALAPVAVVQAVPITASELRPPHDVARVHPPGPPRFLANCVFLI
jgi:hypothetical protein